MKLVRFGKKGYEEPGILHHNRIFPLRHFFPTISDIDIRFWAEGWAEKIQSLNLSLEELEKDTAKNTIDLSSVRLGAPIAPGGKLLCVGKNYQAHVAEGNFTPSTTPQFFCKTANTVVGPYDPILLPVSCPEVDWEVELAVIIGEKIKRVDEKKAEEAIFGYTVLNDVSGRTAQFADSQWFRGKSFDSFAPIGPCIVTKDELGPVEKLALTSTLNGQVMQSDTVCDMIFSVPQLVSYISQDITLCPGDLISTGTPQGVGYFRNPKILLQENDLIVCTISSIGSLENPIIRS